MAVDPNTTVRVIVAERARLSAYIWSIVRDEHTVDDVLQEVSVLALEKCNEIEHEAAILPWLRSAARFRALRAIDSRKRFPKHLSEQLLDQLDDTWAELDSPTAPELTAALRHCLRRLSPRVRRLIKHRYVDGQRATELAQDLGQPVNTIYTALSRAYKSLRQCLHRSLKEEGSVNG